MTTLQKSHRAFGYVVARTTDDTGTDLVILQTAPHERVVSPAHMLQDVSPDDLAFEVRFSLIAAIEKAKFLGLDNDAIRAAFDLALASL